MNETTEKELRDRIQALETALRGVMAYLSASYDIGMVHAVHIPPAQLLRRQADELEAKDKAIEFAHEVLRYGQRNSTTLTIDTSVTSGTVIFTKGTFTLKPTDSNEP